MNKQKESCDKRIREALSLRGMKQTDLVRLTGIGKSAISEYVAGKYVPKQNATYAIAKALNVSEAWLMGYNVPIQRGETIKTAVTEEEHEFLKLFNKLDDADKKHLKNYINNVLLAEKESVTKNTVNA